MTCYPDATGAVLQADPWECWKLYEETHQLQQPPQPHQHAHRPFISGGIGGGTGSGSGLLFHSAAAGDDDEDDGHYPFAAAMAAASSSNTSSPGQPGMGRSASTDDVAAFLPPSRGARGSPSLSPALGSTNAPSSSGGGGGGSGSSLLLPQLDLGRDGGGLTSPPLHQFPRPPTHPYRGGGGGGPPFARPPSAGDLAGGGLQDSVAFSAGGFGGGAQSTLFLPGQARGCGCGCGCGCGWGLVGPVDR